MKNKLLRRLLSPYLLAGLVLGATGGYLYYYFIGCERGCLITSSPYKSMAWGLIMGGILGDIFYKPKKEEKN